MIEILVFGLVVLSSVCLWLLIEQRKSWKFLIWFIPILLVLVTSTYVTYTSILGFPRVDLPKKGMYLKHHIDEPNWIYLWVLGKNNVPMSYQIVYSKETHQALEGVRGKAEEGDFMIIEDMSDDMEGIGDEEENKKNARSGFTIGGDMGFYKWEFESSITPKDTQQ
jgi:hypothetical protein